MFQLDNCPFCKKAASFITERLGLDRDLHTIFFNVGCQRCQVYAPHGRVWEVSYTLQPDGELVLKRDDREKAAAAWNNRGEE